ncbi:hypothetical protein BBP40_002712 [Aspergillus hancockii]|nr:hypothetical protein BBP40_002712 [Aspergillus hancockii]
MYRHIPRSVPFFPSARIGLSKTLRPNRVALYQSELQFSQGSSPGAPNPLDQNTEDDGARAKDSDPTFRSTILRMMETAATTFTSIAILGAAGYSYHQYYKYVILQKMENAFEPGDPALEVAGVESGKHQYHHEEHWVVRDEQPRLDQIIKGGGGGRYFLLIGEKGTGKTSMLLEAMRKIDGDGCAMFEAHGDLEIFRIRLGKALDYEFHEDYIGSLFSIKGPRDTTPLLDIERAFNKLEKVALARRRKKLPALILIINSTHLVRDDHDGQDLLEMIQQRAEQWAASNLVTTKMDDDVMDEQKYSSAAMVLAKALVDKGAEMEKTYDPETGHILPQIPLHEAREIMTRADFIQSYDHDNLFTIDSRAMVRADSVPMQNAFKEICAVDGFDEHLEGTLQRISDIESLGRTREITIKDLWNKGKYQVAMRDRQGRNNGSVEFTAVEGKDEEDERRGWSLW